ncbi:hypothetical protein LTR85_011233 [Meristemomyces frigidus]|nr:hypothetical protein LTR85_011233 [Meristemomyces frigidus]
MCGRYALSLRPSQVRQRLADQDMPADEAPEDDEVRQTYNFAPGYHGLIYRANTSERGGGDHHPSSSQDETNPADADGEPSPKRAKLSQPPSHTRSVDGHATKETHYKLQTAQWGLIPFWTKRAPDYASKMKTINCRDDSLIENRGMWNTMKQRKRCVVIAEGFYEWLKKNGGKEKIPHFVKRKDGALMCFAGLWDCVSYEGSQEGEKLWTYTVITTDSNKQLSFLHDRMPVILEPGSEAMRVWLDPERVGWDRELQGMLKPFQGELECYPVDRGVGKVGNNSAQFVVPVDSKENKKNIANFFGKQKETAQDVAAKNLAAEKEKAVGYGEETSSQRSLGVKKDEDEERVTSKVDDPETNAPLPKPASEPDEHLEQAIKTDTASLDDAGMQKAADEATEQSIKREMAEVDDATLLKAAKSLPARKATPSPVKSAAQQGTKRSRSAVSNGTVAKTPTKEGNTRITSFFGK